MLGPPGKLLLKYRADVDLDPLLEDPNANIPQKERTRRYVELIAAVVTTLVLALCVALLVKAMHQTGVLNLANRLSGGAVANTVTACRLIAGEEAEAWVAERPVPILFGYADAEQAYEAL